MYAHRQAIKMMRNATLFRELTVAAAQKMSYMGQPTLDGQFPYCRCTRPKATAPKPFNVAVDNTAATEGTVSKHATVCLDVTPNEAAAAVASDACSGPYEVDKIELQIGEALLGAFDDYSLLPLATPTKLSICKHVWHVARTFE